MSKGKIERKIAVIFATDVVGYSKHMETDESETIHNLRECEAILLGLFTKHEGRLFNTGGDSFLAEFPSTVSAQGKPIADAVRQIDITVQTYNRWRKEYGGMSRDQLKRLKLLEYENTRLRRTMSDLTLDKIILN